MVDWSLANGNGFQNALATGLQLGRTIRESQARNALGDYVLDRSRRSTTPANGSMPPASGANGLVATPEQQAESARLEERFARSNPELFMRMQAEAQQERLVQGKLQRQQVEQQRADLPTLGKLLKYGRQGPQQWSQALSQAQKLGLDVSSVPQQLDPQWADEQIGFIDAISTPQGAEALSTAGKQAADMGYRPGTPEFASVVKQIFTASEAKPYVVGGETRLYTPQIGGGGETQGGIPPGALEALKANPALAPQFKEKYGIDPAQLLGNGGAPQPAAGGFPSGL